MNLDHAEDRIQSDRAEVNTRFPLLAALPEERTRAEQIFARFKIFHTAHGEVWRLFCVLTHEELARDRQPRADAILHEIRARLKISINNDFAAYYSRLFSVAYPALANVFKKRKRTSAGRAAQRVDIEITDNGGPENEDALIYELTELAFLNSRELRRP